LAISYLPDFLGIVPIVDFATLDPAGLTYETTFFDLVNLPIIIGKDFNMQVSENQGKH